MSEKYIGSQASKDTRQVTDLTPVRPVPPTFATRAEYEGFQVPIVNAFKLGLLPESIKTPEAAITVALKGRELGLDPLYSCSVIYLVHGKPALEGEAMLGLVLRRYPNAIIRWVELSHSKAVLELGRPNSTPSVFKWDLQDALRAGLITKINEDGTVQVSGGKDTWKKYTRKMLAWRVISEAVTLLFPECIQGCLTPDELNKGDVATVEVVDAKKLDALFAPTEPTPTEPLIVVETSPAPVPEPAQPIAHQDTAEYRIPVGQFFGKKLSQIPKEKLTSYLVQLKVQNPTSQIKEMVGAIERHLA